MLYFNLQTHHVVTSSPTFNNIQTGFLEYLNENGWAGKIFEGKCLEVDDSASIDDFGDSLTLKFKEISVTRSTSSTSNEYTTILRPLTGELRPGHLTAIMGGSGAGKSTLLRALMGRLDSLETLHGTLLINDIPTISLSSDSLKSRLGFVPQEDIMHDDLTVEQNLALSSEWRLNHDVFSLPKRKGIVNDILERLKLENFRHLRVGRGSDTALTHISGGQKKRVNIGIELVADPAVLFLDEPTSGKNPNRLRFFSPR